MARRPVRIPLTEPKGGEAIGPLRGAGVPVGLEHDGANRNDHKLLKGDARLDPDRASQADPESSRRGSASTRPTTTPRSATSSARYELTPHIRTRGEEIAEKIRTPGWRARRWVVEAVHSWLNRNRGILIRWSKKDENHLALLQLASGLIAFKKAHAAPLTAQPA